MAYNMEKAKKFPNTICRNVAVFPVISTQEKHVLQVGMKCYQQCSCVHFPRLQWRWLRLSLFRPKSMEYNMRFLLSCACVCGYVDYIQIFMEIANFFFYICAAPTTLQKAKNYRWPTRLSNFCKYKC